MNASLIRISVLPVSQAWLSCTWPEYLVEPKLHHLLVKKPYLLGWFHCSAHTANRPLPDFKPSYPIWSTTNCCSTHERHYFAMNTNKLSIRTGNVFFFLTLECSCFVQHMSCFEYAHEARKFLWFSRQGDIYIDTWRRLSIILRSLYSNN